VIGNKFGPSRVWYYVRAVNTQTEVSAKSNKISYWKDQVEQQTTHRHRGQEESSIPAEFTLSTNFPNPFNPTTTITFKLPENARVRVSVFNTLGQEIKVLVDGPKSAGSHEVVFDASEFESGIYFCVMTAGTFSSVRKMVLIK
jgi:hypothetical protein